MSLVLLPRDVRASGAASQAQFHAFTDTWNWADAAQTYAEFVDSCPNTAVVEMVEALHSFLKTLR